MSELPAGWIKRPFWEAWTRGRVEKWQQQWGVELGGKEFVPTLPKSARELKYFSPKKASLRFPTPLAAMVWVELEIANTP